jgi:hypothetical protein
MLSKEILATSCVGFVVGCVASVKSSNIVSAMVIGVATTYVTVTVGQEFIYLFQSAMDCRREYIKTLEEKELKENIRKIAEGLYMKKDMKTTDIDGEVAETSSDSEVQTNITDNEKKWKDGMVVQHDEDIRSTFTKEQPKIYKNNRDYYLK